MNEIKTRKWGLSRVLVIEFVIFASFFAAGLLIQDIQPVLLLGFDWGSGLVFVSFVFLILIFPITIGVMTRSKVFKVVLILWLLVMIYGAYVVSKPIFDPSWPPPAIIK